MKLVAIGGPLNGQIFDSLGKLIIVSTSEGKFKYKREDTSMGSAFYFKGES